MSRTAARKGSIIAGAVATVGLAFLLPASALAQAPGAANVPPDGRDVAIKLCASCHAIERDAKVVPRADIPGFHAIAIAPGMSPDRLAAAIILPHPEMPGIALTRAEIRAVIAYIMSLRTVP
jgi:mono/diheme cytochrome c family protein